MDTFDLDNELENIQEDEWWEIQKYKTFTFQIQWTPRMSGWVRARLDSLAEWNYMNCGNPRIAEQCGLHIIKEQKRKRCDEYDYCPLYQGA